MRKAASSTGATNALALLSQAQHYFVSQLRELCEQQQLPAQFMPKHWLRDNGLHGGGLRYEAPENSLFNQASVNVSQIQFEDDPSKSFISATALSTIIHPLNPSSPSVHIHVSWTELRSGKSYWRLMADLNPAIACESDKKRFNQTLQSVSGTYYSQATEQGDEYFYIPALHTHRGVSHFYLEGFNPEAQDGAEFAQNFISAVIDVYIAILTDKLNTTKLVKDSIEIQQQLDYHTLYFYQVLTLDKGTTAGLLVHDQNDVGTLGSLPRFINRSLLKQWIKKTPSPANKLVSDLVSLLPEDQPCEITSKLKAKIAQVIRDHYEEYAL